MKFIHVKEKKDIELYPIGDVHQGSNECLEGDFLKLVEHIRVTKNARVILMGDLIDACLKNSPGAGTFDNDMTPQKQLETMEKMLIPIKDKIWCLLDGNHEARVQKTTSIDVSKILARYLNIPYAGSATMIKARVGNQNYSIFATHGASGSTGVSGKLNTVMKYAGYIQADLYMMGHVHELAHHKSTYYYIDNGDKMIKSGEKHFVITGHYLKYGGYAEQKGYKPGNTGTPQITLSSNSKKVEVNLDV